MVAKKREILIKLEEGEKIGKLLDEIKELDDTINQQFKDYEALSLREDEIFENWNVYLEDIIQKLEHTTL